MTTDDAVSGVVPLLGYGLDAGLVGGKGAALDRLVGRGVRVPPSLVITTDVYRAFVSQPAVASLISDLGSGIVDASTRPDAVRAQVDARFLEAPMPDLAREALRATARTGHMTAPWAVRSSATAEDMGDASFAGQYESFLGVGPDGLERAVRLVWASLWHPAPRAYRRVRGMDEHGLAMAVVIMEMLEPSYAGVVFTTDPVGRSDTMRIEFVEGLGDQLVAGDVTPTVRVVDRAAPSFERDDPPLLDELVRIAIATEAAEGRPQDIEWAAEDDAVWVVQTRPITTVPVLDPSDDGFDVRAPEGTTLTTAGVAEMVPGYLPPRIWELNAPLLEEGFRRLFASLGAADPALADPSVRLLLRVRGRAALDLDTVERVVDSIPGGSAEELEHQYFGEVRRRRGVRRQRPRRPAAARQGLRTVRARHAAAVESEITIQTVDAILALEPELRSLDDQALLSLRARVVHVAGRSMAAEMAVAAMAAASYRGLERFIASHLRGVDPQIVTQQLTATDPSAHHGGPGAAFADLADQSVDDPVIERARAETDWSTARTLLAETGEGRRWLAAFDASLERTASTSVFGGSTWSEVPELAWPALISRSSPDGSDTRRATARSDVEARLGEDRAWRFQRALRMHVVDVRRHFLRREATEATAFLVRRERSKAALLRLGGLIRRIDVELGRRLVERGRLASLDDVDVVTSAEIAALLNGHGPSPIEVAGRVRKGVAARRAGPLPNIFEGLADAAAPAPALGDRLQGWPASPGSYEGPARVVTDPSRAGIRRGDVLIARNTDASWAPLFLLAGAIVVEEGGPLSHAAVVARELGVPAVVNVPGLCERLDREPGPVAVLVDGSAGDLVLHRQVEAEAEVDGCDRGDRADIAVGSRTGSTIGVVPSRRAPRVTDDDGTPLGVFVTGLVGAGALMSVVFALTEAVGSRRAERRFDRRARPVATAAAAAVVDGIGPTAHGPVGLRSAASHAALATASLLVAAVVGIESTARYFADAPGGAGLLLWAVVAATSLQLAIVGMLAAVAAWRWPEVPLVVRRRWPARRWPPDPAQNLRGPLVWGSVALLATFVALMVMNLWLPGVLGSFDRRVYDVIGGGADADRIGPEWLGWFGRPRVVIPLAVGIGLASLRCRPLALLFPLSIAVGGTINILMTTLVGRQRPPGAALADATDSFPSGHAVSATLFAGVLPLAVHVMTGSRAIAIAARLIAALVACVLLVDQIRQGGHWPTDYLAGACIGLACAMLIHALIAVPANHDRCHGCPWKGRERKGTS